MTSPCIVNTLFRELFMRVYKPIRGNISSQKNVKFSDFFLKYRENVAARGTI